MVDYVGLVLSPLLRRLCDVSLDAHVHKRGFQKGVGDVEFIASSLCWPLPAFDMLDIGTPNLIHGLVYRSSGVPAHVLPRLLEGQLKKRATGAAVTLRERLPETPTQWETLEVETSDGNDGCGVLVVIETDSGCRIAGNSFGRKGAPAEKVGMEAAQAACDALHDSACVDEHLEKFLLPIMAVAVGTSRIRLGSRRPSSATHAAIRLLERFNVKARLVDEKSLGLVLEVDGVGDTLRC
eukprot:TRINITY_DN27435_c0_g1_i5.p1 TRINITY_DN27435_c0_g1~~TRINITY_DN27435_c0_g1_i5.p1  ORF type:complete len:265 (+),score=38.27 TRINITY_DN27435_c0_g1_i5:83-796(+)